MTEMLFKWSKLRHGAEYVRDYESGFKEVDSALAEAKNSLKVCDALLEAIGPNGTVIVGLIINKVQDQPAAARATGDTPLKMTAAQLLKAVGNNELRLRQETESAGGLLVTGKVENVENGYFWSGPMVRLHIGDFSSVMAYLKESERDAAKRLNSGDNVTILCRNPTNITKDYWASVDSCIFK